MAKRVKKSLGEKIPPSLVYSPQKKLGQNFLFNKNYLQKIVTACPFNLNTIVIEIGSGYGNLTSYLAQVDCQKIISLEKDPQLFKWITENNRNDKIIYLCQDALKVD